jgi:hypothetical protein
MNGRSGGIPSTSLRRCCSTKGRPSPVKAYLLVAVIAPDGTEEEIISGGMLWTAGTWARTQQDRQPADLMSSYRVNFATRSDPIGKCLSAIAISRRPGAETASEILTRY